MNLCRYVIIFKNSYKEQIGFTFRLTQLLIFLYGKSVSLKFEGKEDSLVKSNLLSSFTLDIMLNGKEANLTTR